MNKEKKYFTIDCISDNNTSMVRYCFMIMGFPTPSDTYIYAFGGT